MGRAGARSEATRPTFVIQEHHARALHWDFRLEHDGVLVSWALPKGLPESPSTNHLAVHTEDHPLEYADFEGEIPKGEYGGGGVSLWDHGVYDLEKWSEREVMVVLHGTRANGRYVLFRTGGKNWMIHRMDPPREGFVPVPEHLLPMEASTGSLPDSDEGWAYEFIWDGLRALVHVDGGRIRATGPDESDLSRWFPELREIGAFLGSRTSVIDGCIASFDETGVPSFSSLQERLDPGSSSKIARLAREAPVTFLAFDILYLEGRLLIGLAYTERREHLESLGLSGKSFACPPSVLQGNGKEILRVARERRMPGIVAKRANSLYSPGLRTPDWIEIANTNVVDSTSR
jgi:bifunctional non-homologous end joining protein LigD